MKRSSILLCLSLALTSVVLAGCAEVVTEAEEGEAKIYLDYDSTKGNVTISPLKSAYVIGDKIKIIASPYDGFSLKSISLNNSTVQQNETVTLTKKKNTIKVIFESSEDPQPDPEPTPDPDPTPDAGRKGYTVSTNTTYLDLEYSGCFASVPSVGKPKILVVPVQFSDYTKFSTSDLSAINATFIGTNSDGSNNYWESLKSFYYKSSYGKLDLDIVISDVYVPSITGKTFRTMENTDTDYGAHGSYTLLDEVYSKATINGSKINYKDFDTNSDGYVDGVWMIYNAAKYNEVYDNQYFWAYSFNNYNNAPNISKPTYSKYANCSQIFLSEGGSNDAHTLIHETGHMLGLDDYYSYDDIQYGACGGLDMMDFNVGDHNAFSKFSLGWIEPTVITDSCEFTLKPITTTGDCIILSAKSGKINSAFNEYIVLEYYTGDKLYELDATKSYGGSYPRYQKDFGVRIFHIDGRLVDGYRKIANDDDLNLSAPDLNATDNTFRMCRASNTASYSSFGTNGKYNLIEAITPSNKRSYNYAAFGYGSSGTIKLQNLFFTGDTFSTTNQSNFFISGKMHDGSTLPFTVKIGELTSEGAKITITKK